jgi:profilin
MAEASPWQPYIDDHLMIVTPGQKFLKSAAIIGHDGLVWAQSEAFPELKPNEFDNIMRGFDDSALLAQHGLFLGGVKYMVIKGEPGEVIRAKKGTAGVNIKKSISSVVFGIYDEPVSATECSTVVEKLGDYLIEQGY